MGKCVLRIAFALETPNASSLILHGFAREKNEMVGSLHLEKTLVKFKSLLKNSRLIELIVW